MKTHLACALLAGASLVSLGASAQSAAPAAEQPKAIGVTQATANEANRKATPDGAAASVVRTGPSAADKAHRAMSSAKQSASKAKAKGKQDGSATPTSNDVPAKT